MQADADFDAYVAARWPTLVRTVTLLGCPAVLAPDVVAGGLGRSRRDWRIASDQGDVEALAHRAVLDAWAERRRGPWWEQLHTDDPGPDLAELDGLTPDVRAGLVLRRFADLDAAQAAAVAGPQAGESLPDVPSADTLRQLAESVDVYAPPDSRSLAADRPRKRRLVQAAVVVPVAAVVFGAWAHWVLNVDMPLLFVDSDVEPDAIGLGLDPVEPHLEANPAEVAWYAEDVLHLENATYVLPTLRDLAVLGAGAAYGDFEGRVVHLSDDGTRTLLGTKDPVAPLAASDASGWVAWVDPAGLNPRLLVYDVGQGDIIGELDLPESRSGPQEEPDTYPVAIDQQTVYFLTSEGARAWRPTRDPGFVETVEPSRLFDVASANRLSQVGTDVIVVEEPFEIRPFTLPGRGGELSDDGEFVVTRSPLDASVVVYDVSTRQQVGVAPPEPLLHVVDVALAPEGSITYLVVDPDAFPSREGVNDSTPIGGELVTCRLDDGSCESSARFVLDSEAPILAR